MMFGRRRRNARLIQATAPEPVVPALTDERVFELVHGSLSELIGVSGDWTLVPRQSGDTDEIFHGLKAQQIATLLTKQLAEARDAVPANATADTTAADTASTDTASTDTATTDAATRASITSETATTQTPAEPAALPWSPAPISVWAEPERAQRDRTEHDHAEHDRTEQKPRLVA
ncbi:hypothetical protein [Glaciibacter superstes]|uniref:hypothetical protein n=1 Tax=Glaciibacter superstes TaxID=501023 RepID=UPI0003B5CE11|nr:hypothetical protein [Glaciibacter superstes]